MMRRKKSQGPLPALLAGLLLLLRGALSLDCFNRVPDYSVSSASVAPNGVNITIPWYGAASAAVLTASDARLATNAVEAMRVSITLTHSCASDISIYLQYPGTDACILDTSNYYGYTPSRIVATKYNVAGYGCVALAQAVGGTGSSCPKYYSNARVVSSACDGSSGSTQKLDTWTNSGPYTGMYR